MQSRTFLPKCVCPFGMPKSSNSVQAAPLRIGNQYAETGNSGFKQLLLRQCLNKQHLVLTPAASPSSAQTAQSATHRTASEVKLVTSRIRGGGGESRGPCGFPFLPPVPPTPARHSIYLESTGFSSGKATGNSNCNHIIKRVQRNIQFLAKANISHLIFPKTPTEGKEGNGSYLTQRLEIAFQTRLQRP